MTVVSGLLMVIAHPEVMKTGAWIHIKMSVALLLIVYHFSLGYFRKTLANDTCTKSGNFFRAYNEIPTIFLILIAVLAVLKSVNLIFVGAVVLFGIFVIYRVFKQKAH